ncbi:hypothetical protein RJ641_010677 [Dillenia turbinata]|uniref:C2H2-type domain-containing protein n=1 Tax=Dillenia turbinata TaxID=194707 RepID=A0AAN8VBW4_9MAGN
MAPSSISPGTSASKQYVPRRKMVQQEQQSSWDKIKKILSCQYIGGPEVHDPTKNIVSHTKFKSSCSSLCSFKDASNERTKMVRQPDYSSEMRSQSTQTRPLSRRGTAKSSTRLTIPLTKSNSNEAMSASRRMQLRKLSGCDECHMVIDPSRYPTARRAIYTCLECGEAFVKAESLEIHQTAKHAGKISLLKLNFYVIPFLSPFACNMSKLGPEDSGRNIVEIIFKSSWLKRDNPICKIERILKVHNTRYRIQQFEECREAIRSRANNNSKKNPRCAADGNELLRFHCTTITCQLGSCSSSDLCSSFPGCGVCTIIRNGFQVNSLELKGVHTCASSGRAHDCLGHKEGRRAMLVCRVIAGRVKSMTNEDPAEEGSIQVGAYDSVASYAGVYSNLEELFVFNPRAILPCFVVIYRILD